MDHALVRQVAEALATLARLRIDTEKAIEVIDQLPTLAAGFDLDQHANIAIALKDARDAVALCKTRLTNAQQETDKWFGPKIASDEGSTTFRTDTHTFSAGAKAYASVPSQRKSPDEFKEVLDWLRANGHEEIIQTNDFTGLYALEGFDVLAQRLLEDGSPLPPHVTAHIVDSVTVRRRS